MSTMMLEQVQNEMRAMIAQGSDACGIEMQAWADAIDAELKSRGEPVAFRYLMPVGHAFAWTRWLDAETRHLHAIDDGRKVEYVYTAPPAPKIEVTNVMCQTLRMKLPLRCANISLEQARIALDAALKETP